MTDFTPGPWQWKAINRGGSYLCRATGQVHPEAILYVTKPSAPSEPNARLIAQAPALYEALEAAKDTLEQVYDGLSDPHYVHAAVLEARAVLASARGEQ